MGRTQASWPRRADARGPIGSRSHWTRVGAAAALAVLVGAALGSDPGAAGAYVVSGESLGLDQRDMRVVNSFADAQSNDNTTPEANFPGTLGAPLAIRKAHAEWSSEPWAGNGAGDPVGGNVLGSGGANFDNSWQGVTMQSVGVNGNVHIALPTNGGSTLAYTETPVSDGWRIVYLDAGTTWLDGPGAEAGGIDIQAVATHEIGHTLGLGHSTVAGATMGPALAGLEARSIEADDVAGLVAIYGPHAVTKPRLLSIGGSHLPGQVAVLNGGHFAPFGNEAWFTSSLADGTPLVVGGLVAKDGGTRIEVVLPADGTTGSVADGEVLVHVPGTGGATLSNAFPLDVGAGALSDLGGGLPGGGGSTPLLTGDGDLDPLSPAGLELQLAQAAPGQAATLFLGGLDGPIPFHGGSFVPVPVLAGLMLATDSSGEIHLSAPGPLGLPPGLQLVLQAWIHDPGVPGGLAGSNALLLAVPAG